MIAIPSRHKSLVLLAGVVIVQMLFLAVQIKRDSQGRLIRSWTVGAISPFERTGAWGFGRVRGIWTHYFALQNTSRENEDLRRENDALKLQLEQLRSKARASLEPARIRRVTRFFLTAASARAFAVIWRSLPLTASSAR